jgi:DNA-directed RNA polymerase specialized sigma24 family protein
MHLPDVVYSAQHRLGRRWVVALLDAYARQDADAKEKVLVSLRQLMGQVARWRLVGHPVRQLWEDDPEQWVELDASQPSEEPASPPPENAADYLADAGGGEQDQATDEPLMSRVRAVLRLPREFEVFFGIELAGRRPSELATELGISRARVSQLRAQALAKLQTDAYLIAHLPGRRRDPI